MDRLGGRLCVSPSDLVGYVACRHLSTLDLGTTTDGHRAPQRDDPDLAVVQRRGLEHEAAYLQTLIDARRTVVKIEASTEGADRYAALRQAEEQTVAAMRDGADIVFQATFLDESEEVAWRGHADFLERVDMASDLGEHAYEPVDTKLARTLKPSAVLQLCHYAEQLRRIQGIDPAEIHAVLGDQERASVRLAEVAAYYRATKARFLTSLGAATPTYPVPVAHCALCRWNEACEQRWAADDHLCRVATLTREQARKLEEHGISTLAALAASPDGLTVRGIGTSTLDRLRHQGRMQHSSAPDQPPPVEPILPVAPNRGLAALPEPCAGDLFYDIEGDPYVDDNGLEYLHGLASIEDGEFRFQAFWAHDPAEEKRAFEQLIDAIVDQRQRYPDMHVYHYAPYETTALGRLMGRYATREDEYDDLLRGGVFVDLYGVVRQGLVVGSPSYSIKKLEPLYMDKRTAGITDAASSIVEYERWLETRDQSILDDLEQYNADDVQSTWLLRDWLEQQRQQLVDQGHEVVRPMIVAPEVEVRAQDVADEELAARLLDGRDDLPQPNDGDEVHARWLMAQLLQWHRREAKPEWWRFFDRVLHSDELDLLEDSEAIAGLEQVGEPTPVKRSFDWRYQFDPDQEHKFDAGDPVLDPDSERRKLLEETKIPGPGSLVAVDRARGELTLRRGKTSEAPHPRSLIPSGPISTVPQREALRRLAAALLEHGIDGAGPGRAARQLLARRLPAVNDHEAATPLRRERESTVDAANRLASGLEASYLPIQGPPGSGKTFTATDVIVSLVAEGKKVGITANSHAVIGKLLQKVAEKAAKRGISLQAMQKVTHDSQGINHPSVEIVSDNGPIETALVDDEVQVVAGTSWLFAREELVDQLDTLVIDEAGQLSLANVLAVAPSARNLLLVGDPRQLAQPSRGSHPPGAEVSALEHALAGAATVSEEAGLFLDLTWRLHPAITEFISEQVYDGRLESQDHCERQRIHPGPVAEGSGLRWLPVEHDGNRTSSPEEAAAVRQVIESLLGRSWTDGEGNEIPLALDDILVVAPYNAHVHALSEELPVGARIGTVDAFQGQEAPVVVVSLAASSAEDVPRGMEFLYSRNRLNVAVSRAKALSVLVASPQLLAVDCRSIDQMQLANVLCRYVELADQVSFPGR